MEQVVDNILENIFGNLNLQINIFAGIILGIIGILIFSIRRNKNTTSKKIIGWICMSICFFSVTSSIIQLLA